MVVNMRQMTHTGLHLWPNGKDEVQDAGQYEVACATGCGIIVSMSNYASASRGFYPEPLAVADKLQTAEFILRPLTPAHVHLDYVALMAGKEMLRLWSGSPWPTDDFTLAANREDLRWHDREHRERVAFTYTVLDTAEEICLGCVYVKPLKEAWPGNEHVLADLDATPTDALVRFWVTQPYLRHGLDRRLLDALIAWFTADWAFRRVFFHTRVAHAQQVSLFDAALQRLATIVLPDRGGDHYLYG